MKKLWVQILFGYSITIFLFGCSISSQETVVKNPTHIQDEIQEAPAILTQEDQITFEVIFDENENCIVSGPKEVQAGDYFISLDNQSDKKVDLAINHLIDGHTYQDVIDLQSEPGAPFVKEYWMSHPFYFTKDHRVWKYTLDEPGEYVILILQHVFEGIWICDPFQVIEANHQ